MSFSARAEEVVQRIFNRQSLPTSDGQPLAVEELAVDWKREQH